MSCSLCDGEEEDYSHLFFRCSMVQEAWRAAGVACLVASSDEAFWSSLKDDSFRREMDWRLAFATRAMRRSLFPGAIVSCPLCDGEEEDYSHLFFRCSMV